MVDAVRVLPAYLDHVPKANTSFVAIFGGVVGGLIMNPSRNIDQNLPQVETLYVNLTGDAQTFETATNFAIQPGGWILIPPGLQTGVRVASKSAGHRFSAYVVQPGPQPPQPVPGNFPPSGPVTLLNTIKSYLYWEYQDDDDLQAFVAAQNSSTQEYVDWFNQIELPVYTNPLVAGTLLDWVALGLYGMRRPTLASGGNADIGPLNTALYDQVGWDEDIRVGPSNVTVTTDDIFKRIMTWRLYRGDGKQFSLFWLKRRIMRFLNGQNGTDPGVTNTYPISAFYASRTQVDIVLPADPNASVLKQAIDSGAVELPFQLTFSVTIAP